MHNHIRCMLPFIILFILYLFVFFFCYLYLSRGNAHISPCGINKVLSYLILTVINPYKVTQGAVSLVTGFQKWQFNFREWDALVTHRVTPLSSQSVACGLMTSHFSTCSDSFVAQRAGTILAPVQEKPWKQWLFWVPLKKASSVFDESRGAF